MNSKSLSNCIENIYIIQGDKLRADLYISRRELNSFICNTYCINKILKIIDCLLKFEYTDAYSNEVKQPA